MCILGSVAFLEMVMSENKLEHLSHHPRSSWTLSQSWCQPWRPKQLFFLSSAVWSCCLLLSLWPGRLWGTTGQGMSGLSSPPLTAKSFSVEEEGEERRVGFSILVRKEPHRAEVRCRVHVSSPDVVGLPLAPAFRHPGPTLKGKALPAPADLSAPQHPGSRLPVSAAGDSL